MRAYELYENEKFITELFDQPYDYKWFSQTKGAWRGTFKTASNDEVEVNIENFREKWIIEFTRNDIFNVTGDGDAVRIFSTVIAMIDEFISIESPLLIKFSADKAKSGSDSRAKLYTRMINRFANKVGYSSTARVVDDKVFYVLRMKEDLNKKANTGHEFKPGIG